MNIEESGTSNSPLSYHASSSISDSNGNLYLLSNTLVGTSTDITLTKFNASGSMLWIDSLDVNNLNDYGVHLTFNADGDVLICGAAQHALNGYNILVAQYDTSGTIDWTYEYDGVDHLDDIPSFILCDDNSNVYVSGGTNTNSEGVNALIFKLDNSGNFQWDDSYDTYQEDDAGVQLTKEDASVLLFGGSESSLQNGEYFVLRYDPSGNQLASWTSPSGVSNINAVSSIERSSNGVLYLCGTRQDDLYVVALDSLLDTLWTHHYDYDGGVDFGKDLCLDADNNLYVTGYGQNTSGGKDAVLIKLNASGVLEWDRAWSSTDLPDSTSSGLQVFEDKYKVFMLAVIHNSSKDLFVAQIDSSGSIDWYDEHHRGVDVPQSFHWSANKLNVFYSSFDGMLFEERLRTYDIFHRNKAAVSDSYGNPLYREDELLVQFKMAHIDTNALDDLSLRFGDLQSFLDSNAVAQIESLGELTNTENIKMIRMVNQSRHEKFSISRTGYRVPVPQFYTAFLLSFPEDINEKNMAGAFEALDAVNGAWTNGIGQLDASANDFYYSSQQSLKSSSNDNIQIEDAWGIETGKSHVRVGIFDSGIMWEHEDFMFGDTTLFDSSVVVDGANFSINNSHKERTADVRKPMNNSNRLTINDHGTQVAGIVGAIRNNELGIAGIAGGNNIESRGIRLVDVKVVQVLGLPTDKGLLNADFILEAHLSAGRSIDEPNGFGLQVANHSYGFYDTTNAPLLEQAYRFLYRNGITQVASRGNVKDTVRTGNAWQIPACYPDSMMLSVGGSAATSGALDTNYSLYGREIDLIAQGGNGKVTTTYGRSGWPLTSPQYKTVSLSGTSFSAPHVAGIAGLIYSYLNDFDCHSRVSHEDVEYILTHTANDKDLPGEDSLSGFGLVSAKKALEQIEWPYYRLYHMDTLIDTSNLVLDNSNISITISDKAGLFMNNLPKGTYNADVYLASAIIPFSPVPDTSEKTLAVWKRLSESTVLPHYSRNNGVIVNRHSVHRLDSATQLLEGYVYKIDLGNGTHQWIPDYVESTGKVHLAYSALTHSSTGNATAYLCDSVNKVIDVPTTSEEIDESSSNGSFRIFPNPTHNAFTIAWNYKEPVSLSIYDLSGRRVFYKNSLNSNAQIIYSPKYPGVYLIQLSDGKSFQTKKLIRL